MVNIDIKKTLTTQEMMMENSTAMDFNTMNTKTDQTIKNSIGALVILVMGPALIGAWSAACFAGLIVSHTGPAAWNLIA
jgi:hypothetical protein